MGYNRSKLSERMHNMARIQFEDLVPYEASKDESYIGMVPLMVGFIYPGANYPKGIVPDGFLEKLRLFLTEDSAVSPNAIPRMCPICKQKVEVNGRRLGQAELRILGAEDIFACPDMLYHYVEVHDYEPPQTFIDAVLTGDPEAPEYRILIRSLQ